MNAQLDRAKGYLPASYYNRTDKILCGDSGFYYKTSDGENVGPFDTEVQAMYDLNNYVRITAAEEEMKVEKIYKFNK